MTEILVTRATKFEKLCKMDRLNQEMRENADNAYACVELLLDAGSVFAMTVLI